MKNGWIDIKVYEPAETPSTLKAILSTRFDSTSKLLGGDFTNTRNGGCSSGKIVVTRELSGGHDIDIGDLIEVHLTTIEADGTKTNDDEKIYYGMVLDIIEDWDKRELAIQVIGLFHMFTTAPVIYYEESTDVETMVTDLFSNRIQSYTWCKTDTSNIDIASPVTVGDAEFEFTPGDEAIKKMAKLQGNVEYGVDVDGKFYFRDEVTIIRNQFQVGLNAFNVKRTRRGRDLINALFIRANHVLSSGSLIRYASDSSSISTYKRRAKVVTAPEFKDASKIDTWASNYLSKTKDERVDYSFKIPSFHQAQWPNGKIKLIDSDGSELATLKIVSITYKLKSDELDMTYKIGEEDESHELGDDIVDLQRQLVYLENQEISNDRIAHTGFEEFKQYIQKNAIETGRYNFVMTEFEEDQV